MEMTEYLRQSSKDDEEDSFEAAIWDWFVLAHYLGMRNSEYGQSTQYQVDYHETPKGKQFVTAFILSNFTFLDKIRRVNHDLDKIVDETHATELKTKCFFPKIGAMEKRLVSSIIGRIQTYARCGRPLDSYRKRGD